MRENNFQARGITLVTSALYPIATEERTSIYVGEGQTRKSARRDFRVQIGRALGLTCVMATPEIASSPPTINLGVIWSPRNNTLEITANTGSSRPNGATRPIEQRAINQNQRPNPRIPPMKIV